MYLWAMMKFYVFLSPSLTVDSSSYDVGKRSCWRGNISITPAASCKHVKPTGVNPSQSAACKHFVSAKADCLSPRQLRKPNPGLGHARPTKRCSLCHCCVGTGLPPLKLQQAPRAPLAMFEQESTGTKTFAFFGSARIKYFDGS